MQILVTSDIFCNIFLSDSAKLVLIKSRSPFVVERSRIYAPFVSMGMCKYDSHISSVVKIPPSVIYQTLVSIKSDWSLFLSNRHIRNTAFTMIHLLKQCGSKRCLWGRNLLNLTYRHRRHCPTRIKFQLY